MTCMLKWNALTKLLGLLLLLSGFAAAQSGTAPSAGNLTPPVYAAGVGTAQAQTVTLAPAVPYLKTGLLVRWTPAAANTAAAPTLAVNGLTATSITKCGTTALVANDLVTTAVAEAVYDGTEFQLLNPLAGACGLGVVAVANGGTNQSSPAFAAQTDGATVTWAIGSALIANATLTFTAHSGSRTLNITGPVNGGSYVLWIKQDSTGGEGLTLGTGCTWKVSGGGAGAVTPSTGASAVDVLAFTYDGTNCYANFNKNFN